MKDIIITTTNNIEGRTIESYLGMVNTNIVLGTNVFSDFAASFSDFFGGTSGTYQKQLQQSYELAMSDLKRKALKLGATAIVGSRLDFDEISGKGKSMFMVSISGTAVRLNNDTTLIKEEGPNIASDDDVQTQLFIESYNTKMIPTDKEWDFIISHPVPQLIVPLFELRDSVYRANLGGDSPEFDGHFRQYIMSLPEDLRTDTLYDKVTSHPLFCTSIIRELKLFCPKHLLKLIDDGNVSSAVKLLDIQKPFYDEEDLITMRTIAERLENLPELGHYEDSKGGFLSSGKRKYICPDGHSNDSDQEYCSICGKNIRGLKQEDVEAIKLFASKVHIISSILQKSN